MKIDEIVAGSQCFPILHSDVFVMKHYFLQSLYFVHIKDLLPGYGTKLKILFFNWKEIKVVKNIFIQILI